MKRKEAQCTQSPSLFLSCSISVVNFDKLRINTITWWFDVSIMFSNRILEVLAPNLAVDTCFLDLKSLAIPNPTE
jgi:hypothetical protein